MIAKAVDRRRSRRLYDEGGYLLTRHDEQGIVGSASRAVELLLGCAPRQIEGRRWHDLVHPADAPAFAAWWGSLGHGASATHAYRLHPRPEDGSVVWVQTLARVGVADATGATEIYALTHDVTPAVERAEALTRERTQLEGRNETLRRDNRALTRFAGDAAHDLRAPLQAITGFAQLLARRGGAELDETSQRFLAMIMGAAGDMADLIAAALEHGQATRVEGRLEPVDCTITVERTLLHLDAEIARTGARVHVGDLPTVQAEPNQLSRVFQNLIANACKPGPEGRATNVVVSAERLEGAWQLSVSDDGAGVPPKTGNASSNSSGGVATPRRMAGRGSASPSAARSWSATAGASGSTMSRAAEAASPSWSRIPGLPAASPAEARSLQELIRNGSGQPQGQPARSVP